MNYKYSITLRISYVLSVVLTHINKRSIVYLISGRIFLFSSCYPSLFVKTIPMFSVYKQHPKIYIPNEKQ